MIWSIKKFSVWKTFLLVFLIILISLGIIYGFLGLYEEGFTKDFAELVIFVFVLAIIFIFFVNWLKNYQITGKGLVLVFSKIKRWQSLFVILLLLFSVLTMLSAFSILNEEDAAPYQIKEWNPYGYYE